MSREYPTAASAMMVLVAFSSLCILEASELPSADGLVLWLDADDQETVLKDSTGHVSRWADKSALGNDAQQGTFGRQPLHRPDAIGGKPAVRFQGSQFLNLGQPDRLDFRAGDPFTIAVVASVKGNNFGTFLSKGGGSAAERAYQFYAAPGRLGAVTYGVMREHHEPPGAKITIQVCSGSRAEVFSNGQPSISFAPGKASSSVDVLVGARRKQTDNTGTYWLLTGDIAEILVYDRALSGAELECLGDYFHEKYGLAGAPLGPDGLRQRLAAMAEPGGSAPLDALAEEIACMEEPALAALRSLVSDTPAAATAVAELLVRLAHKNRLSDRFAALAAELLAHDDPFVRGMADWAITMKVGGENNGQQIVWPAPHLPDWYERWSGQDHDDLLQADWVRQAVTQGIHRDSARMLASVDTILQRAARMQEHYEEIGASRGSLQAVAAQLARLQSIRRRLAQQIETAPEDQVSHRRLWLDARRGMRAVVLANPAIDFDQLVFVKQFTPHTVRNITRSYSWKHKPGGDICVLSDFKAGGPVRNVLAGRLGPGYVWGLDLWWDRDRVVFGFAKQPNWPPAVNTADYRIEGTNVFRLRQEHEPIHLFEACLDGTRLVQLTNDPYWSDFEPTYCADGNVVFASDRCGRSAECGNDTYDHTNPNLYLLSRTDGTVRRLTDSKDIDRYPHSLDDGRIAYTHWEYQERHFMEVHAVWTVRPDGSMADAAFKHHMRAPCGLRDTRSIPGGAKLVSIATGHHTFAYGPVVVVDPSRGLNDEAALSIVTPGVRPQEGPMAGTPVAEGGVPDQGGLYQTPWALGEQCFLVSYAYARPECTAPAGVDSNGFALYLIDTFGNRELIHRDPLFSCTFPIPLRRRPRPPILPAAPAEPQSYATCYVTDVYDGLQGVVPGTIKYIRVAQHVGWPFDQERGQMDYIPGNAGTKRIDFQSWSPVRVIGTVPVEPDGSACFKVPADTAVYFQALDENQMEIVRMRSMVSLKAGEVRGCRGCHESQGKAPAGRFSFPIATGRPPRMPTPPPWGADRLVGYEWLVQPILDRRCVGCHGAVDPDGGLDFTAARAADGLVQSYRTMFGILPGKKDRGRLLVSCSDRFSNADVTRPRQFGSHKSPLIQVLVHDELHKKEARLSPTEWLSLVAWVDANAPYHDAFLNKRPTAGGEPRREIVPQFPLATTGDNPALLLRSSGTLRDFIPHR